MSKTPPSLPSIAFLRTSYRLKKNPFPAEAIVALGAPEQARNGSLFNPDIYPDEVRAYFENFVVSTLANPNGPRFGALWSVGEGADPRGFGKSNLGKWASDLICKDFGSAALSAWGPGWFDERPAILAAYASFDKEQVGTFHSVVFEHVLSLSDCNDGPSVLKRLRERARQSAVLPAALDEEEVTDRLVQAVLSARVRERGRTLDRLNEDILYVLLGPDDEERRRALSGVTARSRTLSGLHYLDALFSIGSLAGIERMYLFVDQVEDLADSAAVPKAKRKREVERFRDMAIELAPFNRMAYFILTMHPRGRDSIRELWRDARLPTIDYDKAESRDRCVILRGIETAEDAERLLAVYLSPERIQGTPEGSGIHPFEPDAVARLRDHAEGRPGYILSLAARVLEEGAKRNVATIDSSLVEMALGDIVPDSQRMRVARVDPTI